MMSTVSQYFYVRSAPRINLYILWKYSSVHVSLIIPVSDDDE